MGNIYITQMVVDDVLTLDPSGKFQKVYAVTAAPSSPAISTPVADSQRTTSGAALTATLAGTTGKTTYIRGWRVTVAPIAASVSARLTITGLVGHDFSYEVAALVGALAQIGEDFGDTGIPASAANTSILVNVPALALATVSVNVWGYQ